MSSFGRVLLLWRIHRGLTQADLAEKSGVPRPNLSRIETDKKDVSLQTLRLLAFALGVTPGTLADGIPPDSALQGTGGLSRRDLEKISQSVHTGRRLSNLRNQAIAENIKVVIAPRLRALNPKYKPSFRIGRKVERAWLELSVLPSSERESLIQRAIEHASISDAPSH